MHDAAGRNIAVMLDWAYQACGVQGVEAAEASDPPIRAVVTGT
jgi:hypothetical protein